MKHSELKQLIKEEIQKVLNEGKRKDDWRNPEHTSSKDFNKIVRQTKSRYSKSYGIDINDEDVAIVTDGGYDIRIVDRPNDKKISVELESDNLPKGYIISKGYEYTEIDKIFKIIDMWLKKYKDWL